MPRGLLGRRRRPPIKKESRAVLDQLAKLLPPKAQGLKWILAVRVLLAPILVTQTVHDRRR